MTMSARIREQFAAWIGSVADAIVAARSRIRLKAPIQLIETDRNMFIMRMTPKPGRSAPPECHFLLKDDETGFLALPQKWDAALRGCRLEVVLMSYRFLSRPL